MKTNKLTIFPIFLALAVSCGLAEETAVETEVDNGRKAVIVNTSDEAIPGELLIKFRPELTGLLDQAGLTKSSTGEMKLERLGIRNVDDLMDIIGGYEFERVFPVNPKTEETARKEGLHLWYIVRFDEGTDVEEAASRLSALGELSKVEYSKYLKRSESASAVPFAASQAGTTAVFNDPGLPYQWHYINTGSIPGEDLEHLVPGADVGCAEAWKKCTGDPSIIVAVMDEGVMWSHPDLQANMWVNEDEIFNSDKDNDGNGYAGDVYGYNFAENSPVIAWNATSDTGHGTHVAGTIAAVNNNGIGVSGVAGGSGAGDGVKIMSIQIFSGNYGVNYANEVRAIKYAADNGAVILQCSWGYNSALADPLYYTRGFGTDEEYETRSPLEKEAFDYFIYHAGSRSGVIDGGVVIFAAGNEAAGRAAYPGAYRDYICVAALAGDYTPSTYSNYGGGVDISAPGGDTDYYETGKGGVYSTMPPRQSDGLMYGYMEGTSMACPHMSGVAALGLSYAAKLHKHYDSREYKDILLRSARNVDGYLTGEKMFYYMWGALGDLCPTRLDLSRTYKGNMGAGMIDAGILLNNIEGSGTPIVLPNVYVATGASQKIDAALCFDGGEKTTFTASVSDPAVANVSVSGRYVTVTGVATGTSTLTVTAGTGKTQTSTITVREGASSGGGWL